MIRKNEGLGERPFFERVEMRPAKPISGRVETPEGRPAAGVEILAYSRTDKVSQGQFEYGSFSRATTDSDGKFRLPITTPGLGVFWIMPRAYAPEMHIIPDGKRGELGAFTLKPGEKITGRLFDVQGKPLAKVYIEADRERENTPEFEFLNQLIVSDAIRRTSETDAEGRFTLDPLPRGKYSIKPTENYYDGPRAKRPPRRELPGVFAAKTVTITEGQPAPAVEIRALPHVVIDGQWFDSKGEPKTGWSSFVFGRMDGGFWQSMTHPDSQGRFSVKVPHGLEQTQVDISTNEHASMRHRMGKSGPLVAGRQLMLGTLDHDVRGIEIVRYAAPIIVINATTKDGKQIEGFRAKVEYTSPDSSPEKNVHVAGGGGKRDAIQDEQNDGRYRTSQLLPDCEVNVTVSADGYTEASRKMTLAEGKTEEVTLILDPK
jgi:hypothetical protein